MLEFLAALLIGTVIGAAIVLAADNIRDVVKNALSKTDRLQSIKAALNANQRVFALINQASNNKVSMTLLSSLGDCEDLSITVDKVDESIKMGEYYLISDEN